MVDVQIWTRRVVGMIKVQVYGTDASGLGHIVIENIRFGNEQDRNAACKPMQVYRPHCHGSHHRWQPSHQTHTKA